MAFDLGNKSHRERFWKAEDTSRQTLLTRWCRPRAALIQDYVGSWYSPGGAERVQYLDLMNQTARIYTMALAFNNPQCKINSFNRKLWPFCTNFEIAVNNVVRKMDLRTVLRQGVLDAFFLWGIFKTRLADAGLRELVPDILIDPGRTTVDRVSVEDLIVDLSAKDVRRFRFFGDRYRVPLDNVKGRDDYEKRVRDKVTATSRCVHDAGSQLASEISTGQTVDDDELEPMVWLADVYFPETEQMATFAVEQTDLPPLKVWKDDTGPLGPYDLLSLGIVPDNVVPSSPAQHVKLLYDLANRLYRKMAIQAGTQKTLWGYPPGGENDADNARAFADGQFIKFTDPKQLFKIDFPGVDGNTNAFFLAALELANAQAGNPRAVAGLGRVADTVGQEQIVTENAGNLLGDMKEAVVNVTSSICRKIGLLLFDDGAMTIPGVLDVAGTGYMADATWIPGRREGEKGDYDFEVEPTSMEFMPSGAKVQRIFSYVREVAAAYPLVQAGVLDIAELTRIVAHRWNDPDIIKIFRFMEVASEGARKEGTKPAVTTRNEVRSNKSAGVSQGGLGEIANQMLQGSGNKQMGTAG